VGDVGVGKTCAIISYTTNAFPGEYIPGVMECYPANIMWDCQIIQLAIVDMPGGSDYDRLRQIAYKHQDIIMVCFSLVNRQSLHNAINNWIPEVRRNLPNVPILLVGTKVDLRKDDPSSVQYDEGLGLAQQSEVVKYLEMSALTCKGFKKAFDEAIRLAINAEVKKVKGKRCNIQ